MQPAEQESQIEGRESYRLCRVCVCRYGGIRQDSERL